MRHSPQLVTSPRTYHFTLFDAQRTVDLSDWPFKSYLNQDGAIEKTLSRLESTHKSLAKAAGTEEHTSRQRTIMALLVRALGTLDHVSSHIPQYWKPELAEWLAPLSGNSQIQGAISRVISNFGNGEIISCIPLARQLIASNM